MEKEQALYLSKQMDTANTPAYDIHKLTTIGGILHKFHQWTNGKKVLAAFEITRMDTESGYYFLFIDWHKNENYYLVIYEHDRSTTVAEIQVVKEIDGFPHFVWMYKPFKRDGKNDLRKAYFKQMFGSTTIQIQLPPASEVSEFLDQLFTLCHNRKNADRIAKVFNLED